MSESNHTPGPWKWLKGRDDCIDSLWGGQNESQNVLTINEECRSESDRFLFVDIYDADARLIAAAPDLLAACKYAIDDCKCDQWADSTLGRMLKGAIAKAEAQ